MAASSRPPANRFVGAMRKVYNPVGFGKGYNFVLWFIFAGAMMGFVLARFMYLSYDGVFCAPGGKAQAIPGECYAYSTKDYYRIGIRMHLYTIIPAGFLVCFQFVPVIRHKLMLFHRLNGYTVILLSLAGTVGALMITRVSFGGGLDVQAVLGLMAILFIGSLGLAIYNIKMLQIEQHRAWMLRAWFYARNIITSRFVMIIASTIISMPGMGPYYQATQCDKLASYYDTNAELLEAYPGCTSPDKWEMVEANLNGGSAANAGAVIGMSFGMALWVSLAIHAIGIEIYLHLTPAEAERLRQISYQRQLEAGYRNPGRAGITADRLGDSETWLPASEQKGTGFVTQENTDST